MGEAPAQSRGLMSYEAVEVASGSSRSAGGIVGAS